MPTPLGGSYVSRVVRIECGAKADLWPVTKATITPYVAEAYPRITDTSVPVRALAIERTFWEKATILHAEYHRPAEKALPDRYSRHYYDLAMLAQSPVRAEALADLALLDQVVRHKETFYPSGWARYDLARVGSLRLVPPDERRAALERDYRSMSVMIFGQPPPFGKIIEVLATLEQEINQK